MADSKRKTLYEDKNFRLVWDEETRVLESTSTHQMSSSELRATLDKVLTFMKDKNAHKYLSDTSNSGTVAPEDMLWVETDWFPRCLKAGMKALAIVMPKSLAGHLVIDKAVEQRDPQAQGVVRGLFKDIESAREWIVKQ